jgi:preprotein translocase subunit SecF
MSKMERFKKVYEGKYKLLLLVPFVLLILAIAQIGVQFAVTGDFVNKGISLKGGSTITIQGNFDDNQQLDLQSFLREKFTRADITVRKISSAGITSALGIDSDAQDNEEISALLLAIENKLGIDSDTYTVEVTGSSLGNQFFKQTLWALALAFVLMGIVVFLYFRTVIPSCAVILAAASDMVITLAIFNLTGMKLGSAGIAAFLMLIGYSVDTDIMLSTKMLKQTRKSIMERVYGAMKTGLTMTTTTFIAVLIAFILAKSDIVRQIMIILAIGLLVDVLMTYIQNVGILRMYLEKKQRKGEK